MVFKIDKKKCSQKDQQKKRGKNLLKFENKKMHFTNLYFFAKGAKSSSRRCFGQCKSMLWGYINRKKTIQLEKEGEKQSNTRKTEWFSKGADEGRRGKHIYKQVEVYKSIVFLPDLRAGCK